MLVDGSFEFQIYGRNGSSGSFRLATWSFDLWENLVVALKNDVCVRVVVSCELVRVVAWEANKCLLPMIGTYSRVTKHQSDIMT